MLYRLSKKFRFEAAHYLPNHKGKCQRLHGHSWLMEIECLGNTLNQEGSSKEMLIDFGDISQAVKPLLDEKLDHYLLNDSIPEIENPTSEEIARWIYNELKTSLPFLSAITIHETYTSSCRYEP